MLNIVWMPWTCTWNEDETLVTVVEQACDPDWPANQERAYGPVRTTVYDAVTFDVLAQAWIYNNNSWAAPTDEEQAPIDAWQAYHPEP
jgi:hypothetical protein